VMPGYTPWLQSSGSSRTALLGVEYHETMLSYFQQLLMLMMALVLATASRRAVDPQLACHSPACRRAPG
jgi:hypothetical protein